MARDNDREYERDRGRGRDDDRERGRDAPEDKKNKSVEVKLTNVRLSFESVFKRKSFGEDDANPRFSATFLIDKRRQEDQVRLCEDAIDDAKFAKWGDRQPTLKAEKLAFRDGDDEDYDGYQGHMFVAARSDRRPKVIDRDRTPLTEDDGRIYSGCYVNAIIRFWAQDNKWGKRVNASLEGIQFVKDGEAFTGGAPLNEDAFDDLGDEDDGRSSRGRGSDRERDRGSDRDRSREPDRGRDEGRSSRSRDRDDRDSGRGSDRDRGRDRGADRDNDRGSRDRVRSSNRSDDDFREDEYEDRERGQGRERDSRDRDRDADRGRDRRDDRGGDRGRDRRDDRGGDRGRERDDRRTESRSRRDDLV
jgi:hypothetical protein